MEKKTQTIKEHSLGPEKLSPTPFELKKHEAECKRIGELLKDVQRQQKAILNNIPDIAWLKDKEGKFISVNEPFAKACGRKPEEIIGKTDLDIWPRELAERYRKDDEEVMLSGERKRIEEALADKEGKIKWVETVKTPIFNSEGEVVGTTGIAHDITERKKLEERLREARAELEIRVRIRTAELSKTNEDLRRYVSELRQTEEMLRTSEARYRAIIEGQEELVCRFLPDGTLTFVSDSYCKYFGKSKEGLLGKRFLPVASDEDRQKVKNALALLSKNHPSVSYEEMVKLPDGRVRWQFWNAQMLFDSEGHFLDIQAVGRDVTELKHTEEELMRAISLQNSTLESTADGILVVDLSGKVVSSNNKFLELWHIPDELAQTRDDRKLIKFVLDQLEDPDGFLREVEYLYAHPDKESFGVLKFKDGRIFERFSQPQKLKDRIVGRVWSFRDVSERKLAEEKLKENEERYRRIAETITDYIFTVQMENGKPSRTIYGPTCVNVTGYTAQEFVSDPYLWINIVPKEDHKLVHEHNRRILQGEKNLSLEHRIVRKDGQIRWVRNTSVSHFDSEGKLLSYDGLIQDITEKKVLESRISRINDCFLSFGTDPLMNINLLTSLCGELMEADCAIYNRFEGGFLCALGQWNTPSDLLVKDKPEGHICFDVIKNNEDEMFVVQDLQQSSYAKTDSNVVKYGLGTYIGYPVRLSGETIGSLCAIYKKKFTPTPEDKKFIGIIASAIGIEEERRKIREIVDTKVKFEETLTSISNSFIKLDPESIDKEINSALEKIGRFFDVDRSYIFLFNEDLTRANNVYEWCAEGIESQRSYLQDVTAERLPWFAKKMKKLEILHIPKVADMPPEAGLEKEFVSSHGIKSLILVPLAYGKYPIGLIGFDACRAEKVWSRETIALLKTVGEIFTNAIEHKKSEEKIHSGERFLNSIFTSIQDGLSILDKEMRIVSVNPTMEKWYAHYMPLVGKKCFFAYHNRKEPCKVCPSRRTLESGEVAHEVVPKVGAGGEVIGWLDLYSFPLFDAATGKLNGAIEYVRDITEHKRVEKKLEILNKELLKSNQHLKQLALRDSHTGLFNHRYLEEVIEAEFYRARRYAHPMSILMLDIDYFKSINDVYGHQFGDLALKQLARYLKKMVRRYDVIIRFGGEEFIVIFPGTDRSTALVLAQRLLDSMNTYHFGNKEHEVKLKLSIAVVSYPDDKIVKGMDMVELADQILNKVKESGGNKVYSSIDTKKEKALAANGKSESGSAKFLQDKLEKLNKRANQSLIEAVFAFAKTIEVKDHYTGEHVESTVHYATEIANAMNLPKYEIELIKQAAMLHDLGKIGISEKILLKSSKLDKKEFEEIKKHPQIGVDIIRPIQFFHNIIPLMLYHHERWDGKGYPRGLKGEEIPIGARIIAISDVYQALTSHRPYRKKAYTKEEAIKIIKDGAGSQFDPKIVNVFLGVLAKEK